MRIDPALLDALQRGKERDGIPISEQVRRAIHLWIEARGLDDKSERQRARTRKRS